MCTVTFIARRNGYALGMNRDEKLTRAAGLPPCLTHLNGRAILAPSERGGGTWIGVNDTGATLALINWYSITSRVGGQAVSRGEVVKLALPSDSSLLVDAVLKELPLARVNPFRLIGVFPACKAVVEWRWNHQRLERRDHCWRTNTWISSGFDEPGAQQTRGRTFGEALRQTSAGSTDWLRRLHRSHGPECGPYSTCMHREDAATVSYTEVTVSRQMATLRYAPGAPCCTGLASPCGFLRRVMEQTASVDSVFS
ncbi:MAG TPA: NRDE family protein [Verrucomicrobiae bacterium]|nr:NRDE family protein [Verrucomicrobiae bacterium]